MPEMVRSVLISCLILTCAIVPARAAARRPRLSLQTPTLTRATQTDQLPRGQIVERVVCANDAKQSYALYLPANYSSARAWPILYGFDPGARGRIPVERFKDAAEKYGWIVVGSNNSRNGPLQQSGEAFKAVWNDANDRFALDPGRAYTTGMSGGARVAVMLAHLSGDRIAGVIGSGAGFPEGVAPKSAMRFVYFAAIGVDDFNFPEVKTLEDALLKAGLAHHVRVFTGHHEWAPPEIMTEAIEWLELQAMKAGKRQRDDNLINELWQKYSAVAKSFESANQPYEAYQTLTGMAATFKGLHETNDVEKSAAQLRESRAVKDAIRGERQQISRQRENEREIYTLIAATAGEEAFDSGTRLRSAIAGLQKSAKAESDTGDRRVARRVTEGLFIGFSEQGRNLLQVQKDYSGAVKKLELAVAVAPERAGASYYLAQAYALNGNRKQALQAPKNAIDKGFADRTAITENKAFDSLRKEPLYAEILLKLTP